MGLAWKDTYVDMDVLGRRVTWVGKAAIYDFTVRNSVLNGTM